MRTLVIGYGNIGRLDDGLGPALAEAIGRLALPGVSVDSDYQLVVEDAVELAQHDAVIFADADASCPDPFYFRRLSPEPHLSFSSHSVQPAALLFLAADLFAAKTKAYVLGIRGYEFNEFGERLSGTAQKNLAAASDFLRNALCEGDLDKHCQAELKTA
ncbi:MAG: hypothetical protein A2X49_06950 [Lentisphaerae bacterium GWF2_52_8]|nr:MAG: hypothetical protein A2X49_06950 [Lentisphaerae bacterium GWF2_52_8]